MYPFFFFIISYETERNSEKYVLPNILLNKSILPLDARTMAKMSETDFNL